MFMPINFFSLLKSKIPGAGSIFIFLINYKCCSCRRIPILVIRSFQRLLKIHIEKRMWKWKVHRVSPPSSKHHLQSLQYILRNLQTTQRTLAHAIRMSQKHWMRMFSNYLWIHTAWLEELKLLTILFRCTRYRSVLATGGTDGTDLAEAKVCSDLKRLRDNEENRCGIIASTQ